jgi:ribosomal protein L14E/L6E/L27E
MLRKRAGVRTPLNVKYIVVTSDVFQDSSPMPEIDVASTNKLFRLVTREVTKFACSRSSKQRNSSARRTTSRSVHERQAATTY